MTIQDLLKPLGITTYRQLSKRTKLSPQRAHQIWYGRTGVGRSKARIISNATGIAIPLLLSIEPKRDGKLLAGRGPVRGLTAPRRGAGTKLQRRP